MLIQTKIVAEMPGQFINPHIFEDEFVIGNAFNMERDELIANLNSYIQSRLNVVAERVEVFNAGILKIEIKVEKNA